MEQELDTSSPINEEQIDVRATTAQRDGNSSSQEFHEPLSSWRPVFLRVNSVLEWERKYDPMIIFTFVTLSFVLVLCSQLSVLTFVSLAVFIGLMIENVAPFILAFFSKISTSTDAEKYDRFCQRLTCVKGTVIKQYRFLRSFQEEKPTEYFVLGVIFLLILAIYGQMINNVFFSYFAILIICLIPGILHQRLLSLTGQMLLQEFHRLKTRFFP